MQYHYLIVGAGLFGATFAYEMNKRGKKCLVIERRNHIGGNIYCETVNGIQVHKYGAHIFHTSDRQIWNYVNQFAEFNHYVNSPIANYKGELYNLPFNMNTFTKLWRDVVTPAQAMQKIEEQKAELCGKAPENLEEQAISLVGRDIYETLIKGYTQKQWGRDCTKLPAFIIRRIPVRFTFDNNYFEDPYQGIPIGGYNGIVEKMLAGCDVLLETDYLREKETYEKMADCILYTGMIDEYFDYCFGYLEYRSLRFETEVLEGISNYQGNAVVNYTEREIPYTRIIEHKHFEPGGCASEYFGRPEYRKENSTVITREYPCSWKAGEEAYYPVNDERNMQLLFRYQELARQKENVIFGGRLGSYRYYNMDQVIKAALELCEKVQE